MSCNYSSWACMYVMPDFSEGTRQLNFIRVFGLTWFWSPQTHLLEITRITSWSRWSAHGLKNFILVEVVCSRPQELPYGRNGLPIVSKITFWPKWFAHGLRITFWSKWYVHGLTNYHLVEVVWSSICSLLLGGDHSHPI